MLHVVLLVRKLETGGAEIQTELLARGLDKTRFKVTFLTFYPGGILADRLLSDGFHVISLDKRGRWDLIFFLPRLIAQLCKLRPDIVYGFQGPPNLLSLAAKPLLRGLKIIWGIRSSNTDFRRYDRTRRWIFDWERRLSAFPDRIVVNSNAGRDFIVSQGFHADNVSVIHNGIDTSRFYYDANSRETLRKEWGVGNDELVIGMVARFDIKKDHQNFIHAAARTLRIKPNTLFVLVGGANDSRTSELKALARELQIDDRIRWCGERTDTPAVYSAFDISTLSSAFGEGFPNVVGEAMATQCPCVVTDVGDAAALVGNTGVVVPPGNPTALADGWDSLLGLSLDERRRLGLDARAKIKREFSEAKMVDATALLMARV